jgi:hypothetical protein
MCVNLQVPPPTLSFFLSSCTAMKKHHVGSQGLFPLGCAAITAVEWEGTVIGPCFFLQRQFTLQLWEPISSPKKRVDVIVWRVTV